jgi:hypothetical protein
MENTKNRIIFIVPILRRAFNKFGIRGAKFAF